MHSLLKRLLVDMNLYPPFSTLSSNETSNQSITSSMNDRLESTESSSYCYYVEISDMLQKTSRLISKNISKVGVLQDTNAVKDIKQD